jgi:hypothetical protein
MCIYLCLCGYICMKPISEQCEQCSFPEKASSWKPNQNQQTARVRNVYVLDPGRMEGRETGYVYAV